MKKCNYQLKIKKMQKEEFYIRTKKSYNAIADKYSSEYDTIYSMQKELDTFISFLNPNATILDLGCGHGRDLEYFLEKGFDVIGIDNSSELLGIAKKRVPSSKFIEMDIRDIDSIDLKFDGIWANAILHHLHIEDIEKVCIDISNRLNPSGILFLSVKSRIPSHWDSKYPKHPRYFIHLDKLFLKKTLEVAFFQIISIEEITEKVSNGNLRTWLQIYAKTAS